MIANIYFQSNTLNRRRNSSRDLCSSRWKESVAIKKHWPESLCHARKSIWATSKVNMSGCALESWRERFMWVHHTRPARIPFINGNGSMIFSSNFCWLQTINAAYVHLLAKTDCRENIWNFEGKNRIVIFVFIHENKDASIDSEYFPRSS